MKTQIILGHETDKSKYKKEKDEKIKALEGKVSVLETNLNLKIQEVDDERFHSKRQLEENFRKQEENQTLREEYELEILQKDDLLIELRKDVSDKNAEIEELKLKLKEKIVLKDQNTRKILEKLSNKLNHVIIFQNALNSQPYSSRDGRWLIFNILKNAFFLIEIMVTN